MIWQATGKGVVPLSRMGDALIIPFTLDAPIVIHDLRVYCEEVFGVPIYAVELIDPILPVGQASLTADPTLNIATAGWTTTGAPTPKDALSDASDATYVSNAAAATLVLHAFKSFIWTNKRIGYVEVVYRSRASTVGARSRALLRLNDIDIYGPWQSAPLDDWGESRTRWSYNPQGPSVWPWGDVKELTDGASPTTFAHGVDAEAGVEISKMFLEIGYADDNRVGAYGTAIEFSAGWNQVLYDASLSAGTHYLALVPVVVDQANYVTIPTISPADQFPQLKLGRRASTGFVATTKDLNANAPLILAGTDRGEGQPYYAGSIRKASALGDSLVSGTSEEFQIITGAGETVGGVAVQCSADTPTAALDWALYDTVLATDVVSGSIPASDATRIPSRQRIYFADHVLVAARVYHLRFSSSSTWRVIRLDGFEDTEIYGTFDRVDALPASTVQAGTWTVTGAATLHQAIDDPVGFPDETTTYIQQPVGASVARFQVAAGAFSAVSGTIDHVAIVIRAGSGTEGAIIEGVIEQGGTEYAADDWGDETGKVVTTAFDLYRQPFTDSPNGGTSWTVAEIGAFEAGGSASFGFKGDPGTMIVTQAYLSVAMSDGGNHLADLTRAGIESTNPGVSDKDFSDLMAEVSPRPEPPATLTVVASDGHAHLSWGPGAVNPATFDAWNIYRVCSNGKAILIGSEAASGTTSFVDVGAPLDIPTTYIVRTLSGDLESEDESEVATIPAKWAQIVATGDETLSTWAHLILDQRMDNEIGRVTFAPGDGGAYETGYALAAPRAETGTTQLLLTKEIEDPDTAFSRIFAMPPRDDIVLKYPGRWSHGIVITELSRAYEETFGGVVVTIGWRRVDGCA